MQRGGQGLAAFITACVLLPHGASAAYDAWWMARCIVQGAVGRCNAAGISNARRRVRGRRECKCEHRGGCRWKCKCANKCERMYERGHPRGEMPRRCSEGSPAGMPSAAST